MAKDFLIKKSAVIVISVIVMVGKTGNKKTEEKIKGARNGHKKT